MPQAFNFIKKETLVQVFSYEISEIFKNTFFKRTPGGKSSLHTFALVKLEANCSEHLLHTKRTPPPCVFLEVLQTFSELLDIIAVL